MTKIVLTQRADSGYNDVPGERYHFPSKYLKAAQEGIGDGCLFYEPRRNRGRRVYWACGRIGSITEDPKRPNHYYAEILDFLPFHTPVNLRLQGGGYWEKRLDNGAGQPNKGLMGWSIRRIPDNEFEAILKAGYAPILSGLEQFVEETSELTVQEEQLAYGRSIFQQTFQRPFRDRVFSAQVRAAYGAQCAITGIKIVNGGGRAEMEAAHIRPVAEQGPDSVRNGLALSRTVHWMFDRGFLAVDDDFKLLKASRLIPEGFERLFNPNGYIHVPKLPRDRPSLTFLRWHRENRFKG